MIKYLICAGWVVSQHDDDLHWVSAPQLAKLYGLERGQWRVYDRQTDRHTDLPVLRPRYDGDYRLESQQGGAR